MDSRWLEKTRGLFTTFARTVRSYSRDIASHQ